MLLLFLMAGLTGAAWTIVPAVLKARYGTNEIITTLMMSFIGVDLASLLIKGPFQDPAMTIPQTRVLDLDKMLPPIPGTRIHIGLLVAFASDLRRPLPPHPDGVGAPAADHGGEPAGGEALRRQPPATDRHQLPGLGLPDRSRRCRRLPGAVGLHPQQPEPRLRRHRDPVRLPRTAEPARRRSVHRLLLGAVRRGRPRRHEREPLDRLPPRPRRPDPAVHDGDRIPRAPPRPGQRAISRPGCARPCARRFSGGGGHDPRKSGLDRCLLDERCRRRPARRPAADVHGARRDDLRAGRRAEHRPRGNDAARRLPRLPRRARHRIGVGRVPQRNRRRDGRRRSS